MEFIRSHKILIMLFFVIFFYVFYTPHFFYHSRTDQINSLFTKWAIVDSKNLHFDIETLDNVPAGDFSIKKEKSQNSRKFQPEITLSGKIGDVKLFDFETLSYVLGPVDSRAEAFLYFVAHDRHTIYLFNPSGFSIAEVKGEYWIKNTNTISNKLLEFFYLPWNHGCLVYYNTFIDPYMMNQEAIFKVSKDGTVSVISEERFFRSGLIPICKPSEHNAPLPGYIRPENL